LLTFKLSEMKLTKSVIRYSIIIMVVLLSGIVKSQSASERLSPDKSDIEDQFNYLYQQSSDFEDYKMVRRWWITRLKSHVLDTLKAVEGELLATQTMVESRNVSIDSLNKVLATNSSTLNATIKEKNTLRLLGIAMDKSAYNSIMWTLIAGLAFTLVLFIIMFKRSHAIISETRKDLEEVKSEFEAFRKRALEREEGIVRRYHNEIMHYKNKVGNV
jgi:hypothetical protein